MDTRPENPPIFNAPAIVVASLFGLIAVHTILTLLPRELAEQWVWRLAFVPARYQDTGLDLPGGFASQFGTPVSHMFVHGDWLHLGFNCAWLLAFGTVIARRMSPLRFLAFALLCGLGGALVFWLANLNMVVAMVGASGAVSGLMGGVFRFLFNAPRYGGYQVLREAPRAIPLMTLAEALRDRAVLIAVAVWLAINLVFATDVASMFTDGEIAWEAHVGGFLAGFLSIGLFDQAWTRPSAVA